MTKETHDKPDKAKVNIENSSPLGFTIRVLGFYLHVRPYKLEQYRNVWKVVTGLV